MGKIYPRSSFRRNLRNLGRPDTVLGKSTDVLVYLDYILFLEELLKQASLESRRVEGTKAIRRKYIRDAAQDVLKKFGA